MRARAPGKVVISGAYAVLDGAPALVAAVDRYAYANADATVEETTPEVRALGDAGPFPSLELSELRDGARKLGLGSSASGLVASMAASALKKYGKLDRDRLYARALEAHAAVHGGSGVDVAAATYGGTLCYRRGKPPEATSFPIGMTWSLWNAGASSSTSVLLEQYRVFRAERALTFEVLLRDLCAAAEHAAWGKHASTRMEGLAVQSQLLARLEADSDIGIYGSQRERARVQVASHGGVLLPGGAGGGDVYVLWMCGDAPNQNCNHALTDVGLERLDVKVAPLGVEERL